MKVASVDVGIRVSPSLKAALMRQAADERRTLRAVVEPILEKAVAMQTPQPANEAR